MSEEKPTSLHSWPFEYDLTPLAPNETHVIVRKGKGRNEMKELYTGKEINQVRDELKAELKREFESGATSTKGHRYELIPSNGLASLS